MYKKVYLEITNDCNLSCGFCIKNKRIKKYIEKSDFLFILDKLKQYTKYLYFHVLGEPLLHPDINEFIDIASKTFKVNITTNGYLIEKIKYNKNVRQINISLQSFDLKYNISLNNYMKNIFDTVDELSKYTYISYRFWVENDYSKEILKILNKKYNTNLSLNNLKNNTSIANNTFISINKEFIWPDLSNNYYSELGTCRALKDHIGILVDGTIVPCCLDSMGIIKLGNIFNDDLYHVINSERYKNMLNGFNNNKKCELLCRKCKY